MAKPKDLYMNFRELTVVTNATNSTTLEEQESDSGLSIRGGFMWLIHLIEMEFENFTFPVSVELRAALSIIAGEAAIPAYGDNGLIAKANLTFDFATSGAAMIWQPKRFRFLPPIPIAAPNLSLYAATSVDNAAFRSKNVHCRIGYTTKDMDAKSYLEIAEAWGQGRSA